MAKKKIEPAGWEKDEDSESGWKIVWGTDEKGQTLYPDTCPLCSGKLTVSIPGDYCVQFNIEGSKLVEIEDSAETQLIWDLQTFECCKDLTPEKTPIQKKEYCKFEHLEER